MSALPPPSSTIPSSQTSDTSTPPTTQNKLPGPQPDQSTNSNMSGTDGSHAVGGSKVPQTAQDKLPRGVEENVPNTVHDTGSTGSKSHATGDSKVPKPLQEAVPKKVEEVLPNAIHDTSPKGGL